MANETVTLTAELQDQMSAPLANATKKVEGFTKTVEDGAKKQAAAVGRSTSEISGSLGRQNRLFSGMAAPIGRATDGAARMFGTMRTKIKTALDGLPEYTRQQGERAGSGFANGLKIAAGAVATYFGAQMVGGFIAEAGRASDATDKFKATMNFAGIDTAGIEAATAASKAYADQTVYDLPTIQNTFAQLASNGVKGYENITKAAGNLNAVAGGNAETFKSVSRTLTQSAGAGKLMTEDWNMLADAIPGASGPLQNAMREAGAFEGNFKKAMENGEISADEFQAAIMKLGNQPIAVEAAKSTKTFEGAIGNLQATINSKLMVALDKIKPGATEAIGALTTGLGAALDWTGKAAQGLYDLFAKGDFGASFREAFKVEEDSPIVDLLFDIREMAIEVPGKLEAVGKALWDMRTPIGVIAGLILAVLIPHWSRLGIEALQSAGKQKLAWAMAQGAAVKSTYVQLWGLAVTAASWVIAGTQAMIQGARIAAGWLLAMGPVGWIIGIVALLIGAFVWAYNNIEWFRDGVDAAMKWIGDAVKAAGDWIVGAWSNVVDWWNSTLMPAISAVGAWFGEIFTQIGNFGRDFVGMLVDGWQHLVNFWNSSIVPWLQALAAPFVAAWDWISRLVWNAITIIVFIFQHLVSFWQTNVMPALQSLGDFIASIFNWIWTFAIKPVIDFIVNGFGMVVDFWNLTFIPAMQTFGNWIGSIMTWIYDVLIKPYIDFIVNGFGMLVDFWNLHLIPAFQAVGDFIGSIMNWIYSTLIQPVVDLIVGAFRVLTDWWNSTLMPAAQAVGDWFSVTIGGAINGVKSFIDDLVKNFQTFMTFVGDKLQPVIDGIKQAFDFVADAIGRVLGKLGEFANNPLGGIQDLLGIAKDENGQGIMPQNSGGGVYPGGGVQFAGGGVLGGYAPGRDVIPALLSPGESVLVPELTRALGPANIMAANAEASGGRPAGSGPSLTSGFSSSRGGGTMVVNAPVTIQIAAGADGSVDAEALKAAVAEAFEEIIAEHNRRGY